MIHPVDLLHDDPVTVLLGRGDDVRLPDALYFLSELHPLGYNLWMGLHPGIPSTLFGRYLATRHGSTAQWFLLVACRILPILLDILVDEMLHTLEANVWNILRIFLHLESSYQPSLTCPRQRLHQIQLGVTSLLLVNSYNGDTDRAPSNLYVAANCVSTRQHVKPGSKNAFSINL